MITFKIEIPRDFEDQIRKDIERDLSDKVRREGIHGVTVKLDRRGEAVFTGSDEALEKVKIAFGPEQQSALSSRSDLVKKFKISTPKLATPKVTIPKISSPKLD